MCDGNENQLNSHKDGIYNSIKSNRSFVKEYDTFIQEIDKGLVFEVAKWINKTIKRDSISQINLLIYKSK